MEHIIIDMKYLCRSCRTTCKDIMEHIRKEHNFSESQIKEELQRNPNTYESAFEKIK